MEDCIVIEVTIPIDVNNVDDTITIIIDIIPIGDAVSVPIIELRE